MCVTFAKDWTKPHPQEGAGSPTARTPQNGRLKCPNREGKA
jgi:hypothetical protein